MATPNWLIDHKFLCVGKVFLPDHGDTFVVLPGENVTIAWKIDPTIPVSDLKVREWQFDPGNIELAEIINDQNVTIKPGNIFSAWIDVIKPSTLVLRNVDKRFSGKYTFRIRVGATLQLHTSEVEVFVASKRMLFLSYPLFSKRFCTILAGIIAT